MSDGKFCPQCGNQVKGDALFCPQCGHQFTTTQTPDAPDTPQPTRASRHAPQQAPTPQPTGHHNRWVAIVLGVLALAAVVVVTSNLIIRNQEAAHQRALQASESRVQSSNRASESRREAKEKSLAATAKSVVTDIIQNDDDLDARCTEVTIESHDGGNQYSGYAEVEDDDDDSTTIDITITDVKYDDSVSVHIDGDQDDKLNETFYSND